MIKYKINSLRNMNDEVKFCRATETFRCFSNLYLSPITIDRETGTTVEHYFQAMKFLDHPEISQLIRTTPKAIKTK